MLMVQVETNSGYGYFVKETGESFYEKKPESYKQSG